MAVFRSEFPACVSPNNLPGKNMVLGYTNHGKTEVMGRCGDNFYGEKVICDPCNTFAHARYPQGWSYYPGDTCPHGTYVGGCGIDWMCIRCESGDES